MIKETKDLLLNNYFMLFYVLGLIVSVIKYRKYYDSVLKYLPILIAYTLISESLGLIVLYYDEVRFALADEYAYYNLVIYNIFDIVFNLYFYYVFWKVISNPISKKWIKYGAITFILSYLVNPFFQDFVLSPQIPASITGTVVLLASIFFYFKELGFKSHIPHIYNLLSWISLGLLIFYTIFPSILIIGHYNVELYLKLHLRQVLYLIISIMYTCFILGFILTKRIGPQYNL